MTVRIPMRLTSFSAHSAARWTTAVGETEPKAIQVPVMHARFETIQESNPDKIPTDPVSVFEIETSDNALFTGTVMTVGQDYLLGFAPITALDAPVVAPAAESEPVPLIPITEPAPARTPLPSPGF